MAGGTGLVGIQLIKILNKLGANVYVASLDKNLFKKNEIKKFFKLDLKNIDNCLKITKKLILFLICLVLQDLLKQIFSVQLHS